MRHREEDSRSISPDCLAGAPWYRRVRTWRAEKSNLRRTISRSSTGILEMEPAAAGAVLKPISELMRKWLGVDCGRKRDWFRSGVCIESIVMRVIAKQLNSLSKVKSDDQEDISNSDALYKNMGRSIREYRGSIIRLKLLAAAGRTYPAFKWLSCKIQWFSHRISAASHSNESFWKFLDSLRSGVRCTTRGTRDEDRFGEYIFDGHNGIWNRSVRTSPKIWIPE